MRHFQELTCPVILHRYHLYIEQGFPGLHPPSPDPAPPAHARLHFPAAVDPSPSRERWWILAVGLLILPFLLYLAAIARGVHRSSRFGEPRQNGYGVVIDAGPGSSRVHVFEFLNEGGSRSFSWTGRGRGLSSRGRG
ncbi:hypothetical protein QJS10_CPA16g01303 [Acorus calamus]|uniref:Apyrase n=1 Tax=Acorus calamus TaxID=4465 RepID=A0AAV9D297_ACOCL|nr:hypothetical protein QJS10_CPA16g01303 [Acorus calamus]